MKGETFILAIGGAALAYFFWSHPKASQKGLAAATANGGQGSPGAPVSPILRGAAGTAGTIAGTGAAAAGAAGDLSGAITSLGKWVGGLFKSNPNPTGATPATDAQAAGLQYVSDEALSAAADKLNYPGGVPQPEPAPVDPQSADNSPDFAQGNSVDVLGYAG